MGFFEENVPRRTFSKAGNVRVLLYRAKGKWMPRWSVKESSRRATASRCIRSCQDARKRTQGHLSHTISTLIDFSSGSNQKNLYPMISRVQSSGVGQPRCSNAFSTSSSHIMNLWRSTLKNLHNLLMYVWSFHTASAHVQECQGARALFLAGGWDRTYLTLTP